jgi:hypothetical protein
MDDDIVVSDEGDNWIVSGRTYPIRCELAAFKGVWNRELHRWEIPKTNASETQVVAVVEQHCQELEQVRKRKHEARVAAAKLSHKRRKLKNDPAQKLVRQANFDAYVATMGTNFWYHTSPQDNCRRCHTFYFDKPQSSLLSSCPGCGKLLDD